MSFLGMCNVYLRWATNCIISVAFGKSLRPLSLTHFDKPLSASIPVFIKHFVSTPAGAAPRGD